jgi:hypothetical protein
MGGRLCSLQQQSGSHDDTSLRPLRRESVLVKDPVLMLPPAKSARDRWGGGSTARRMLEPGFWEQARPRSRPPTVKWGACVPYRALVYTCVPCTCVRVDVCVSLGVVSAGVWAGVSGRSYCV